MRVRLTTAVLLAIGAAGCAPPPQEARPPATPQSSATAPLPAVLAAAQPRAGRPVITRAGAARVTRALFTLRQDARAQDNAPMLSRLTMGPAAADAAATADLVLAGARSNREPVPIEALRLAVPRQTRYPAAFLAMVQTPLLHPSADLPADTVGRDYLVIVRRSARTPWRIEVAASASAPPFAERPAFKADRDPVHPGFSRPGGAGAVPRTSSALARYYQSWWETAQPPAGTRVLPGPFTSVAGEDELAGNGQDEITSHGVRRHLEYRPWRGLHERFSFSIGGHTVLCAALAGSDRYTPAQPDGVVLQGEAQQQWGAGIAPGRYRAVDASIGDGLCVRVVARDIEVLARSTGTFSWRGEGRGDL